MSIHARIRSLLLISAMMGLFFLARADEGINVSLSASNNYVIPPSQSYNSIQFNVTINGPFIDALYRYKRSVDWGDWITVSLGNGLLLTDPSQTSFPADLGYDYHYVRVILERYTGGSWEQRGSISSTGVTLDQNYSVTLLNSFDGGYEGGGIVTVDDTVVSAGTAKTWKRNSNHHIFAANGGTTHNGHTQQFVSWSGFGQPVDDIIYYFDVTANATYTANYERMIYTYFQNNFAGTGNGGGIIVHTQQYASPSYAFACIRTLSITAQAVNQPNNGLEYTFSSWSPGGSTSATTAFYP